MTGGWGGDETFGDGDDAHDWGRLTWWTTTEERRPRTTPPPTTDVWWGLDDHPDAPRNGPVTRTWPHGCRQKADRSVTDRSELQIATVATTRLSRADLADPADKENVEASKWRETSHPGADAAAAAPAPPRRMHGWKSNWAVEGMVRAKANSLSRRRSPTASKDAARDGESAELFAPALRPPAPATRTLRPRRLAARATLLRGRSRRRTAASKPKPQTPTEGPRPGLDCDPKTSLAGRVDAGAAGVAGRRAAARRERAPPPRARPVLKTRSSSARRPVTLTLEPWRPFRRRTAATTISASPCRRVGAGTGGRSASPPPPRDG